jgi:fructose-1,6-bisphosphatase/inositol monophosphatase family enzyme
VNSGRDGAALLPAIRELHRAIRARVIEACARDERGLSSVAADDEGDTIYAIDRVSEELLLQALEPVARENGGIVLVAEGVHGGRTVLPSGRPEQAARWVVIVDPIDGTRGLMYQKRSAWVLTGIAQNKGADTTLADIEVAVQTELPLIKQYLSDELWALRGRGARAERVNLLTGQRRELRLEPSRASSIAHGYAMLTRFFPGAREELAALDEELVRGLLGAPQAGKAACFEDQYAATGGQLYELMVGHDRFNADLRPLLRQLLGARGEPLPLCCHPYDLSALLIAQELGVIVTAPDGAPLDAPLDVTADVAWVGYANEHLRKRIEPLLRAGLERRGWLG